MSERYVYVGTWNTEARHDTTGHKEKGRDVLHGMTKTMLFFPSTGLGRWREAQFTTAVNAVLCCAVLCCAGRLCHYSAASVSSYNHHKNESSHDFYFFA